MADALETLGKALRDRAREIAALDVVAGFDGFVDEMISVVEERASLAEYRRVETIGQFAELVAAAAGHSSLREIVLSSVDPGGCAVNFGDGIASLGARLDVFATLGNPRHAAFDALASKCRSCTSWGSAVGRTLALEFADGKYMLSATSQLAEFDEPLLDRVLAEGAFLEACRRARLIAITNWTLYPHMTRCWRRMLRDIFAKLEHRPWFFFDLVDPRSRSKADIREMLAAMRDFEKHGRVILGVNLNEANAVADVLGLAQAQEQPEPVSRQAHAIREKLGISQVATHCLKIAALADDRGTACVAGPFCPKPKKSVGAGDRFNAGFCIGQLLDLPPDQRLLLGAAASGFFVRNARSANAAELADFVAAWAKGQVD